MAYNKNFFTFFLLICLSFFLILPSSYLISWQLLIFVIFFTNLVSTSKVAIFITMFLSIIFDFYYRKIAGISCLELYFFYYCINKYSYDVIRMPIYMKFIFFSKNLFYVEILNLIFCLIFKEDWIFQYHFFRYFSTIILYPTVDFALYRMLSK